MPTVPQAYFPEFERFIALPTVLSEAIRGMDLASFNRRPPGDDWAIRDHVMHLVDYELLFAVRARLVIAEEGSALPGYDAEAWKRR
ncbi:MAG TPA: DinB family protein, partial [Tepidiformaceae bacterium]|nr:DinB family protein [Tepidiformaceae bacterium]